jgi:hypothetical protein
LLFELQVHNIREPTILILYTAGAADIEAERAPDDQSMNAVKLKPLENQGKHSKQENM